MQTFIAISNLIVTVAIAAFALQTWRSTLRYAEMTAMDLLLKQLVTLYTTTGGEYQAAEQAITIIHSRFPHLTNAIRQQIPAHLRTTLFGS